MNNITQIYFNTNPSADTITRVQSQIDTVKDVMIENIDRVLERGEKIELLVDKTDRLNQQAFKFERTVVYEIRYLRVFLILSMLHVHATSFVSRGL
jgi:hypothetical protein